MKALKKTLACAMAIVLLAAPMSAFGATDEAVADSSAPLTMMKSELRAEGFT